MPKCISFLTSCAIKAFLFFSLYKAYAAEEAAGPARLELLIARGDADETDLGG